MNVNIFMFSCILIMLAMAAVFGMIFDPLERGEVKKIDLWNIVIIIHAGITKKIMRESSLMYELLIVQIRQYYLEKHFRVIWIKTTKNCGTFFILSWIYNSKGIKKEQNKILNDLLRMEKKYGKDRTTQGES